MIDLTGFPNIERVLKQHEHARAAVRLVMDEPDTVYVEIADYDGNVLARGERVIYGDSPSPEEAERLIAQAAYSLERACKEEAENGA